jgi:hypothetical protein
MLGPIDFIVLGFRGNKFDGSIMRELESAVDNNVIRVLDLVFLIKDKDGNLIEGEYEDQTPELRREFGDFSSQADMPLLTDHDIAKIGEHLETDTAAGVLVIEHLWAKSLKKAIAGAGGFLVADGRIHSEKADAAVKELRTMTNTKS